MRVRIAALLLALLVAAQPAQVEARTAGHWSAWQRYFATGYVETGLTATGTYAGPHELAVDPSVIPLGAWVQVRGLGIRHAEDTGGAVLGRRLDLWWPTVADCYQHTGWVWARWRRT